MNGTRFVLLTSGSWAEDGRIDSPAATFNGWGKTNQLDVIEGF